MWVGGPSVTDALLLVVLASLVGGLLTRLILTLRSDGESLIVGDVARVPDEMRAAQKGGGMGRAKATRTTHTSDIAHRKQGNSR